MAPLPDPPQNNDSELDGESRAITIGAVITSSDEDETSNNGYQPLPQEEETSDLSSLLTALNRYGVTTIPDEIISHEETDCQDLDEINLSNVDSQSSLSKDIDEANKEHKNEVFKEQHLLWTNKNKQNILLTEEKETEIRKAMAGFTLPETNIPQWAFDVSEEEWKSKISSMTDT